MSVLFNENAKNPLIKGVNLIGDAVGTTFGPNGKNVIIKHQTGVHITKDGATVARYVIDEDPLVQMGIDVINQIANKTAKDVGDGTTTSTILATSIVNNLKDNKEHPIQIQRDLDEDCKKVLTYLESIKKDISSYEDLVKVATLSANNDIVIGKLIADAYEKVGKEGVVTFEESTDVKDSIEFTEGMQLETGYLSPYFINTDKNTCELENVYIAIYNEKLTEVKQIIDSANEAVAKKQSLLIIAPKIESTITQFLFLNTEKLKSAAIISPNHGIYRDIILDDLKAILGESLICQKVIIDKDKTIISGCNSNLELIEIRKKDAENKLKSGQMSEFELIFHRKRIANFVGGIATILVGGYSKIEIKERKDRIEDAISAVRAALDEGVLPGGGIGLLKASYNCNLKYLTNILRTPFNILEDNSNSMGLTLPMNDAWKGINFKTNIYGDMYEMGVIDPFLVTKTALINAVSAASLILTNGCSIINMK